MTSTRVRRHTRPAQHQQRTAKRAAGPSLLEAARALQPRIRALADEIESGRALPPVLVQELAAAGLFTMTLPRDLDGGEVDPVTVGMAIEELARADGSVGWCVMLASMTAALAGFLPEWTAREIFNGPAAVVAGSLRPIGRAVPVDGGYRVTGRWPLASGSSHASWFGGECIVMNGDEPARGADGEPLHRIAIMPASACAVHDTWRALGLRGTASHDFGVEDLFVPAERVTAPAEEFRSHSWPLYRCMPLNAIGHGSHALGVAQGALDDFREVAVSKRAYGGQAVLRDLPRVQERMAHARALVESARTYLYGTTGQGWSELLAGGEVNADLRATVRLTASHAMQSAVQAVDIMQELAGTSAIFQSSTLERRFRDLRTAAAHVMVGPLTFEAAGSVTLGLEAGMAYF
jgi:alkylation response protein AidB-like acyl-CoA dehydrogenase